VWKNRFVPVEEKERYILDHRVIEGPISKDYVRYQLVPVALIFVDIHGQKIQEGLVEPFRNTGRLRSITRTKNLTSRKKLGDGLDQGIMEVGPTIRQNG